MYNKNKKIELNEGLYINQTSRYIMPYFAKSTNYKLFIDNSKYWKAFGIGDYMFNSELDNHIFCLTQVNANIDLLTNLDGYLTDYVYYEDIDNLHMFVYELNKPDLVETFKKGLYSQMYTIEEIDKYIPKTITRNGIENYTTTYQVLTKKEEYASTFKNRIKLDFNVEVDIEDINELDYPPVLSNEIFNYTVDSTIKEINYEYN